MDTEDVLDLLGYHYWATDIILDAASNVSPAQFIASVTPNPGRGKPSRHPGSRTGYRNRLAPNCTEIGAVP